MLSPDTIRLLDQLFAAQTAYKPNAGIAARLADKNMLVFVGPTCAGKNTIMETVARSDSRFRTIGTFTSREPRPGDIAYTYYENLDEGLRPLLKAIEKQRVVQYAVNPYAHTVYGSSAEYYTAEYGMKDVLSSAVAQFRNLGFKRTIVISVTTDPDVWLARFEERFPMEHTERRTRRDEAVESIEWSLKQAGNDHFWVENVDSQPETAARQVIAMITGASQGVTGVRATAEQCLRAARKVPV